MAKIAFIGAGSLVFTRNLCNDIMLTPALQDSELVLMDIAPARLRQVELLVRTLIERRGLRVRVAATLDRRAAVAGADYVITTFQQGSLEAYHLDIEIPAKYGVEQCVGDTLGPGGVFRGLRTAPVLLDLCHDLDAVAPDALLLNYVNPMAINCWAMAEGSGRPLIGLCHSVQGTSAMLARWLEIPRDEINFVCAGINHQAFYLEYRRGKDDLYPALRAVTQRPEIYGEEPVRIDLLRNLGYFVTESSGHASEYLPFYRRSAQMIAEELVPRFKNPADHWFDFGRTGGYLRHCEAQAARSEQDFAELMAGIRNMAAKRSQEYGSYIIEACETNHAVSVNGNVQNLGLITNLPPGCCVEVPCLVNASGIQPTAIGRLPAQLAALNRTNVNVQELAVAAALKGDREALHQAVMFDPLTAAVCTPAQIHSLADEMLAAQARWLPQFQ